MSSLFNIIALETSHLKHGNRSRSVAPITAELVLLAAGIYRACLPRAYPLKVFFGVKDPLGRAYRRALEASGPLWSFGLYGEDKVI
jgi:hypothetical protein